MKMTGSLYELFFGNDNCGRYIDFDKPKEKKYQKPVSTYERVEAEVYATWNKWEIENFHATHD